MHLKTCMLIVRLWGELPILHIYSIDSEFIPRAVITSGGVSVT